MAIGLGGSAAMDAGQITSLGHFPDSDERTLVEIDRIDLRVHNPIGLRRGDGVQ
jgi:glycerate kinase